MLSLSFTTGYAVKALRSLENGSSRSQHITHLARSSGVPRPYLAKIINALSRSGLVSTKRGYSGGVCLARPADRISLLDIVLAIEGEHWIGDCLLALENCRRPNECPTLPFWSRIRREIEDELGRWTLADVVRSRGGTGHSSQCGSAGSSVARLPADEWSFSI